jgi:hypothetical protein
MLFRIRRKRSENALAEWAMNRLFLRVKLFPISFIGDTGYWHWQIALGTREQQRRYIPSGHGGRSINRPKVEPQGMIIFFVARVRREVFQKQVAKALALLAEVQCPLPLFVIDIDLPASQGVGQFAHHDLNLLGTGTVVF